MKVVARTRYCERKDEGIDCSKDLVITKQADKEACDINNIVKKYQLTGQLPSMIKQNPQYGDFASVPDFSAAMEIVSKAQFQFDALDPRVRHRFDNDPLKFLAFATDGKNVDEMVKMGLAVKREAEVVAKPSDSAPKLSEESPK